MLQGSETPRIFTTPRRELTEETSDGFAAIAFAEEMLQIPLFPWQRWLLIHALELNEDYSYRFRVIGVEVARQAGKTMILVVLALWHLYCKGSRTVIATAQDLSKAEDAWSAAVEWAQSDAELNNLIRKVSLAHPKVLKVLNPKTEKLCEYRVASSSRRGGRGFSGDLVLMDELREHQSWDSWGAVVNTMNARPRAQCWAFSNAGDSTSVVLRYLRTSAHRDLGWPDGDGDAEILGGVDSESANVDDGEDVLAWFEWSAPPSAARNNRDAWAQANPSMNHTEVTADCVTDRALQVNLRTQPSWQFDAECLCRWVTMANDGPFPEGSWFATLDDSAQPVVDAKSAVCVEISTTRSAAVIVKAAVNSDGVPVVGVDEQRPGTDWIVSWLAINNIQHVVIRSSAGAPAASLIDELTAADVGIIEWKYGQVAASFGQLFDAVRDGKIKHLSHPGLDAAATSAVVKVQQGGGWIIDPIKSPTDVAPLYGVAGAVWGLQHLPDTGPSIYSGPEGRQVLVI